MKTMGSVWGLLIALVTVAVVGCASSGVSRAVTAKDVPSLAGTWVGSFTTPAGKAIPGTLEMSPTGEYVARAGAFAARGQAQVKDGKLMLTSMSTSGGVATGQRTSTASLSERADGALVLTGAGHSDSGPFNFEVARQKGLP